MDIIVIGGVLYSTKSTEGREQKLRSCSRLPLESSPLTLSFRYPTAEVHILIADNVDLDVYALP